MAILVEAADLDKNSSTAKIIEETNKSETPPVEPEATPAPVEEPAPTPTPDPAPDPVDVKPLLKDIFGEELTPEQAKQKLKEMQESKPEPVTHQYANDYVRGLDEYVKQGGSKDVYDRVVTVKVDELDPLGSLKTLMKWKNPELSDEEITLYLNDKYRQTEEDSDTDKKTGKVTMTIDAKQAKEELVTIQKQHSIPPAEVKRQKDVESEKSRLEAWGPSVKQAVSFLSKLPIKIDEKNVFDFADVDEKSAAALEQEVANIVKYSGFEHNEQNSEVIKNVARERFIVNNFDKIISATYAHAKTLADAEARSKYHNAEPPKRGDAPPAQNSKTNTESLYEKHLREIKG